MFRKWLGPYTWLRPILNPLTQRLPCNGLWPSCCRHRIVRRQSCPVGISDRMDQTALNPWCPVPSPRALLEVRIYHLKCFNYVKHLNGQLASLKGNWRRSKTKFVEKYGTLYMTEQQIACDECITENCTAWSTWRQQPLILKDKDYND